ncbi:hypothetical protein GCM10009810_34210 [Nostocoides vanveenii]|uniref:Uncharacterized protein n=1 Tax=Nostocoides vanveenii TaxID=330835 RepID=A0ABN2L460_9MICO
MLPARTGCPVGVNANVSPVNSGCYRRGRAGGGDGDIRGMPAFVLLGDRDTLNAVYTDEAQDSDVKDSGRAEPGQPW